MDSKTIPPPPHFFGNFKELLRKRCFQPPPPPPPHFQSSSAGPASSVSSMLLDLGWRSLEQRRADSRLTLLDPQRTVPIEASKHLRPMKRRSRHSHSNSFIPISTSSSSRRLSFYPRTITQWNSLPQSIFDNDDLTSFKHSVSSISHIPVN